MDVSWKVINWFARRPTLSEWGRVFSVLFLYKFAWMVGVVIGVALITTWMGDTFVIPGLPFLIALYLKVYGLMYVITLIVTAVFTEELIYRAAPFALAFIFVRLGADEIYTVGAAILMSSVWFGIEHAFNSGAPELIDYFMSLCIQGVAGIFFSVAFLKASGLQLRYLFHGYLASSSLHLAWNAFALYLSYILGQSGAV